MNKLGNYVKVELAAGKTVAQVKRELKTGGNYTSAQISRAIRVAVHEKLVERGEGLSLPKTANANQVWMWAVTSAILTMIIVTALLLYLFR